MTDAAGRSHNSRGHYNPTHGASRTPEYRTWQAMRARCETLTDSAYRNYGARGIRVCSRWSDFSTFLSDVGFRPSPRHTLHRINNDGNYEPGNCAWVTGLVQGNNKRNNHVISWDGRSMTISEWSRELGINYRTLTARIRRGWALARALAN